MSCEKKPRKPGQILIGRHESGDAIVLMLPTSIPEAATRLASEKDIVESCELTERIQNSKLGKGMITREEFDNWHGRMMFVLNNARKRRAYLETWLDAAIGASENDAVAVEQTNQIALLEAQVKELTDALTSARAQRVTEGLREMSRRAREQQTQVAE
jgi:hypothetical protein